MNKAVFLDRDGVINPYGVHVNKAEDFALIDGVGEAIHRLRVAGYKILVVTNQGGVGMGYMTEDTLIEIHEYMSGMLAAHEADPDDIAYCCEHPHAALARYKANSNRRKPQTGMFDELIAEHDIDVSASFMVGDTDTDIIPANKLGITTFFVGDPKKPDGGAYKRMPSLVEVAHFILGNGSMTDEKPKKTINKGA